jgi:tight adherence protein C
VSGRPAPVDVDVHVKKERAPEFGPFGSIINPIGRPFAPPVLGLITGPGKSRLRRRIDRAGRPAGLTLQGYAANKAGCFLVYGSVGAIGMMAGQGLVGAGLLVIGLLQTDIVLWNLSRERQQEIQRQLPDFLDVLTVTVAAGLGFRHALARVAESMPGHLSDEMRLALRQMELGTPLRSAFEELRQRNESESLASFVTAILQAEELGAPLARALTEISVDMRRDAFQHARRRAQRADPQITLIVTFLMLPAMMLLIVAMLWFGTDGSFGDVFG